MLLSMSQLLHLQYLKYEGCFSVSVWKDDMRWWGESSYRLSHVQRRDAVDCVRKRSRHSATSNFIFKALYKTNTSTLISFSMHLLVSTQCKRSLG